MPQENSEPLSGTLTPFGLIRCLLGPNPLQEEAFASGRNWRKHIFQGIGISGMHFWHHISFPRPGNGQLHTPYPAFHGQDETNAGKRTKDKCLTKREEPKRPP